MSSISGNKTKINKNYKINFEGGDLSSDSGLLIYHKFFKKLNLDLLIQNNLDLSERDKSCFLQRVYLKTSGYNNDLVVKDLKKDPILTKCLGLSSLYSQSSMSRSDNNLDKEDLENFDELNLDLLNKAYKEDMPNKVILDIDSTGVKTFGDQENKAYNGHYNETGFHPLMVFDGLTGDLIKAKLRPGNVYTSNGVVKFIEPVIKWYKRNYPDIDLHLRGDSGFAIPGLYKLLENYNVFYTIRLKSNSVLQELTKADNEYFDIENLRESLKHLTAYDEFNYQAKSWDKKRTVKVKVEKKPGKLITNTTYIVTNKENKAKNTVGFYADRGRMENYIKEIKNGFGMKNLSHTKFITNENKLAQLMIIYNLNNLTRRLVFTKKFKKFRIDTIRYKFIKIASRAVKSGRIYTFKFSSSYPYKKEFSQIMSNINKLSVA